MSRISEKDDRDYRDVLASPPDLMEDCAAEYLFIARRYVSERDALAARVQQLEAALHAIAGPDELLDANEGAFNIHAARRMQEQARAALGPTRRDA